MPATDRLTVRIVVFGLVVAVVGGVMFMGFLASTGTAIPDQFDRLVTYLAGALTAVLVTTRSSPPVPDPAPLDPGAPAGPGAPVSAADPVAPLAPAPVAQ